MQDTIEQLLNYVFGIWRYRWLIMIAAWIVAPIGWVVVSKIPDQYESSAQVYVDTDTILRPLLKDISVDALDPGEQFGLMAKELLSRPNLEHVIRKSDLDIHVTTDAQKEKLIQDLESKITIEAMHTHKDSSRAQPNLYRLAVQYDTPEMSYRIVQALLNSFVEGSLSGKRAENIAAQKFLENEIKDYEKKLLTAEAKLREFRRKNINVLPEQGSSYYQRLQSEQSRLEGVQLELREEQRRRDELLRQLRDTAQLQQVLSEDGTPILSPIDQRITALQRRLDELLLTYTEAHPDVSEVRNSIAELEAAKKAEIEALAEGGSIGNIQNPVTQKVRLALGDVEANIAAIEVRQREYQKRVRELQKQIETLPQVEAELLALNRDYDINRKNYDTLVTRREAAKMGAAAELTGEQVKIKVIEPPRLPTLPAGPNRLILSTVVLLMAIGAGIGLALVLSQLRVVFYSQKTVREELGFPVLGTVSFMMQPEVSSKKRLILTGYIMTGCMLIVIYLGVMYFHFVANAQ